jgi:hypothetical protein
MKQKKIASDELIQAYKSISIFGLLISTKRFPYALLLINILSLFGVILSLSIDKYNPTSPQGNDDGEAVGILVRNNPLRIVSWIVIPLLSIYFSKPIAPLNQAGSLIIIGGCFLITILGVIAMFFFKLKIVKSD